MKHILNFKDWLNESKTYEAETENLIEGLDEDLFLLDLFLEEDESDDDIEDVDAILERGLISIYSMQNYSKENFLRRDLVKIKYQIYRAQEDSNNFDLSWDERSAARKKVWDLEKKQRDLEWKINWEKSFGMGARKAFNESLGYLIEDEDDDFISEKGKAEDIVKDIEKESEKESDKEDKKQQMKSLAKQNAKEEEEHNKGLAKAAEKAKAAGEAVGKALKKKAEKIKKLPQKKKKGISKKIKQAEEKIAKELEVRKDLKKDLEQAKSKSKSK